MRATLQRTDFNFGSPATVSTSVDTSNRSILQALRSWQKENRCQRQTDRRVVQALIRAPDSNLSTRRVSSQPSSSFYGSQSGPKHDKASHILRCVCNICSHVPALAVLHGVAVCTRRWSSTSTRTGLAAHSLPPPKKAPVRTCQTGTMPLSDCESMAEVHSCEPCPRPYCARNSACSRTPCIASDQVPSESIIELVTFKGSHKRADSVPSLGHTEFCKRG